MSAPETANFSKIAGPLLIADLLQWGLFGALSVQVYIYYLAFSNDPLTSKILVYAVYAVELAQTILFTQMGFKELAAGFGQPEALNEVGNFWFSVPILSSTVELAVQFFYAYRIKLLSKSNFIPAIVVLFSLVQLGGAIAQGTLAHRRPLFSEFLDRSTLITTGIWNAGSAVCDLIIAAAMTYYLSRWKTSWKPTQQMLQRLTTLFIETGTLTATIAMINFILFILPGHPTYYQTTSGILGKMYSTTMMVVLNSRIVFQTQEESPMSNENLLPTTSNPKFSRKPACDGISITREQWTAPVDGFKAHGCLGRDTDSDDVTLHPKHSQDPVIEQKI